MATFAQSLIYKQQKPAEVKWLVTEIKLFHAINFALREHLYKNRLHTSTFMHYLPDTDYRRGGQTAAL